MSVVGVDENGKQIIVDEHGYQVMMEWEKPYMEALIDNLQPKGHVLEIGFGLAYSSNQIQKYDIKSHTIIEPDPNVIVELEKWAAEQKHEVKIVQGDWQEKLFELGKFDTIFFDDAPSEKYPDERGLRFLDFYYRVMESHVNPGCTLSVYQSKPFYFIANSSIEYSCKPFSIETPEDAYYLPEEAKKDKVMYMPLITFPYGCVLGLEHYALDSSERFVNMI